MANNVRAWSTTAASNGTADSDINAAEGCPPSAVNDAERQMMAKLKNTLLSIEYLDHGYTATFATTTTFASPGDLTAVYLSRRRLKFDCGTTLYGTIQSASYVASNTTVTMVMDSGTTLSSSLSAVYVGILAPTNLSAPANFDKEGYATTAGTSTAYTAAFNPKNVALTNGVHVRIKLDQTCGATPTLAVDGLTAKSIVKPGNVAVGAGELVANLVLSLTYDSTLDAWVIEGQAGGGVASPGSSTDYGIPLWSGTAGTALRAGIAPGTSGYGLVSGGTGANHAYAPMQRKNLAINGGFEIWQRGTTWTIAASSSTTALVYGPDRWALTTGANQACTITRITGITDGSQYAARVQRDSGQTGTGALRFEQAFELPQMIPLRNSVVTVSFTVKKGANYSATSDALAFKLYTGTGSAARRSAGSYTGEATPISQTVTLTTSATRYSYTSSTLGASVSQLSCAFEFTPTGTAGAADYFEVDDFQIEVSPVVSDFERLLTSQDFLPCTRFYFKYSGTGNAEPYLFGYATASSTVACVLWLPAPPRTTPTASLSGTVNCIGNGASATATVNTTAIAAGQPRVFILFDTSSMTTNHACVLQVSGNGGSLILDMEL